MRIENKKKEEKKFIEIKEAVKISQEGKGNDILLEKGDKIHILPKEPMEESEDPGFVFQAIAKDFDVDLDQLGPKTRIGRSEVLFAVPGRSLRNLESFFDAILKEFYKRVDKRWNVSWDQEGDGRIRIFFR